MTTYDDLIYHLVDFLEGDPKDDVLRDARRSVQEAMRDLSNRHPWFLYYATNRIVSSAPYETGTIAYDHTGGTYERQLTLTGGTWPTWAAYGHVVLNNIRYEVSARKSSTVLQLSVNSNPGADVDALTTYSLRRDMYPMPCDFIAADEFINVNQMLAMTFAHPRFWLDRQRVAVNCSYPTYYTIMGDPNFFGSLAVAFYPPPDQAYHLDCLYRRRARQLKIDRESAGTASITADTQAVTGSGTAFSSRHVGCVFRLTSSLSEVPTGFSGVNPYTYERVVVSVESETALTLDSTVPETFTSVKYSLSDPVDIEDGAMLNALLACCEYWMSRARNMKDREEIEQRWLRELERAQETDSRSMARRSAGNYFAGFRRLAHMPSGDDIG